MEGVPDSASAWTWWIFSVVIVSFVVNLLSSYAKPLLDNIGMKYSENRRRKILEAREKISKVIEDFNTPDGINYLKIDLLGIYVQMSIVLIATLLIAKFMYDSIDLSLKFVFWRFLVSESLFIVREIITPLISLVGLVVWLFLLNKAKLISSILREIYSRNPKLSSLNEIKN